MNSVVGARIATKSTFPWHGWLLGGIFLLYSSAAAYDYIMSLTLGESYYRACGMNDAQINYFLNLPDWAVVGWALSVWGGLFGSLALLFRQRIASTLFAFSLLGSLGYILYTLGLSAGREAMGGVWFMPIVLAGLTAVLIFYCRRLVGHNQVFIERKIK
jgi:hypothetical protein